MKYFIEFFTTYKYKDVIQHDFKVEARKEGFIFLTSFLIVSFGFLNLLVQSNCSLWIALIIALILGTAILAIEQNIVTSYKRSTGPDRKKLGIAIASRVALALLISTFTANTILNIMLKSTLDKLSRVESIDAMSKTLLGYNHIIDSLTMPITVLQNQIDYFTMVRNNEISGHKGVYTRYNETWQTSGIPSEGPLTIALDKKIIDLNNRLVLANKQILPFKDKMVKAQQLEVDEANSANLDFLQSASLLTEYVSEHPQRKFFYVLAHLIIIMLEMLGLFTKLFSGTNRIDRYYINQQNNEKDEAEMRQEVEGEFLRNHRKKEYGNEYLSGYGRAIQDASSSMPILMMNLI